MYHITVGGKRISGLPFALWSSALACAARLRGMGYDAHATRK